MTITAGAVTTTSVTANSVQLSVAAATGGTAPYTYQWYRGTTSGFSPGAGNILAGQTAQTLNDTTVTPNTNYYYKNIVTDSTAATATSGPDAIVSSPIALSPNSFGQQLVCGLVDLRMAHATVSCMIDASVGTGQLMAGQAVKMVDSAGGPPKVVAATANSDSIVGFLNYDVKNAVYLANYAAEMSMAGNAIYLYATTPISRGQAVCLDINTVGGVQALVGSSGNTVVGWAYDKAVAAGALIRVYLKTPSFLVA